MLGIFGSIFCEIVYSYARVKEATGIVVGLAGSMPVEVSYHCVTDH